jgi:hypothetical protein
MMPADQAPSQEVKRKAAREVIDILHDIATLLVRPPSKFTSLAILAEQYSFHSSCMGLT